jgi:hypothetical protein
MDRQAMSVWLKVILIVFAAVLVNVDVSFISLDNGLLSSAAMEKSLQQSDPVFYALSVRLPQAAVDVCMPPVKGSALTRADFVRLAKCLRRKHLVSAKTVAAVESDTSIGRPSRVLVGLKTKSETVWWSFVIWGVALALIILVIYRHRRRPPPGRVLPASG